MIPYFGNLRILIYDQWMFWFLSYCAIGAMTLPWRLNLGQEAFFYILHLGPNLCKARGPLDYRSHHHWRRQQHCRDNSTHGADTILVFDQIWDIHQTFPPPAKGLFFKRGEKKGTYSKAWIFSVQTLLPQNLHRPGPHPGSIHTYLKWVFPPVSIYLGESPSRSIGPMDQYVGERPSLSCMFGGDNLTS